MRGLDYLGGAALGFAAFDDGGLENAQRQHRVEQRDTVTAESVGEMLRTCFHIAGTMHTACPDGRGWDEAHLVAGSDIPCESERDALNHLRVMILTLRHSWKPFDLVFVRCEPATTSLDGFWKASTRLFMHREVKP